MVMLQLPWVLLLLLIVPVLAVSAWRLQPRIGATRAWLSWFVRSTMLSLLIVALSQPLMPRGTDDVTVAVVLDRSRSVSSDALASAVTWINESLNGPERQVSDRLALVHVAAQAVPGAMPDPAAEVSLLVSPGARDATDLSRGIELARAILPEDTRNRLLLVSDGLDTVGSLSASARTDLPIDVLVLPVDRQADVRIERIAAPTRAQPGTAIEVEVVLHSAAAASGRLVVRRNGGPVVLGSDRTTSSMPLQLKAGTTVVPLQVMAGEDLTRIDATWIPDRRKGDAPENDTGRAVVLPANTGTVLLVSDQEASIESLAALLRNAGIDTRTSGPGELAQGGASLASIDAVVLVNVPRWSLPPAVDTTLAAWVEATGGGLLMTGGQQSLGAGGWIGSDLAHILPVELDPPAQRQIQRGALVLVMHSCEMERGNYWGRRVCETAIETLRSQDLVGIVEYGGSVGGATWALELQEAGNRQAALRAAARLRYGDMPDFGPSMQTAANALAAADAGQKHMVVISDGDPSPPSQALLKQLSDERIAVTTVQVGGHGNARDSRRMEAMAVATGGQFHRVTSPNQLPQIIIEASQLASRSLIQTGLFDIAPTGQAAGPLMAQALPPPIEAYVLTAPRGGPAATPWIVAAPEGSDPLVAWWQRGRGRVGVITVPPDGSWTPAWDAWPNRDRLWVDLVRWLRPSPDDGAWALQVREGDGGRVHVSLEAVGEQARNVLPVVRAVLLAPDGSSSDLVLQPDGPGRATGSYRMDAPGEWIAVAAVESPQTGERMLLRGASAQAWPDEDRAERADALALHRLAESTGGRVHRLDAPPAEAGLFDRQGLSILLAPSPLWPWLVLAAALLLPVDVAVRRLVLQRDLTPGPLLGTGRRAKAASIAKTGVATSPAVAENPVGDPRSKSTSQDDATTPEAPADTGDSDAEDDDAMERLRRARRRGRPDEEELG